MINYLTSLIRSKEPHVMDLSEVEDSGLLEIFFRVDSKTLINRCFLVCKQWHDILSQRHFWIDKCSYENYSLPWKFFPKSLDCQKIALFKPFNQNLLDDWCDADGKLYFDKRWMMDRGFKRECPPIFFKNMLAEGFVDGVVKGCLSTSYNWATKYITIDLVASGIKQKILDEKQPTIRISELVAHRADCAAIYKIYSFFECEPHELKRSELAHFISEENLKQTCSRSATVSFEQWQVQDWRKVELEFKSYPRGSRFLTVVCRGKDEQFWAGHYGAKMANCSVIVTSEWNPRINATEHSNEKNDQ